MRVLTDYHRPLPRRAARRQGARFARRVARKWATLTPAGRFWMAYMIGATSALGYVLIVGYRDAIWAAVQ